MPLFACMCCMVKLHRQRVQQIPLPVYTLGISHLQRLHGGDNPNPNYGGGGVWDYPCLLHIQSIFFTICPPSLYTQNIFYFRRLSSIFTHTIDFNFKLLLNLNFYITKQQLRNIFLIFAAYTVSSTNIIAHEIRHKLHIDKSVSLYSCFPKYRQY